MAEHLLFSEGLKPVPAHAAIAATFLGQAHIAGTGPDGATCRECVFWCLIKHRKIEDGIYEKYQVAPGHFGKKHKSSPCELKKARCTRPILNKANRLIPHHASACRLFERNDNAPEAIKGA
jgi:hypothetical protein